MSAESRTARVVIGWTIHPSHPDYPHRYSVEDYTPFRDAWQPGQPQHEVAFDLDVHPGASPQTIAQAAFEATNAPGVHPENLAGRILAAVELSGYTGAEAHYSLSVGDTVTVDGQRWLCRRFGWSEWVEMTDPWYVVAEFNTEADGSHVDPDAATRPMCVYGPFADSDAADEWMADGYPADDQDLFDIWAVSASEAGDLDLSVVNAPETVNPR